MGQMTIYLEDELEMRLRNAAKALNISRSKLVSRLLREKMTDRWPDRVRQLAGAWPDLPAPEELRKDPGADVQRERW